MPVLTNEDISNSINESAYESSNRIFNLQGLGQSCEAGTDIGVLGQFASNCSISHSNIGQSRGCHLTYTGNQASVDKKVEDSQQSAQQNLAVSFVVAAKNNKCPPGSSLASEGCKAVKKMKMVPGSHNIENLAETTELLSAMISDTMSNTCSSATGGLSNFLCADSKLNQINIQQGDEVDTIASCVSRNIDKDSIKQRASISIEQTADVTIVSTFQHLLIIGVIALGMGATYLIIKGGSGKPLDELHELPGGRRRHHSQHHKKKKKEKERDDKDDKDDSDVPKTSIFVHWKLKLLAIALVWIAVAIGIYYIKKKNIGGKDMTNADLMTPSMCQDCTKYKNRGDCRGKGLCTWVPKPVSAPNICPPATNASPISCLSSIALQQKINLLQGTEGNCTCEPIFNNKTGDMMGDCTNQCPNFRNQTDCLEALCGWAETDPVLVEASGKCIPMYEDNHNKDPDFCQTKYHNDEAGCRASGSPTTAVTNQCKWLSRKVVQNQGGGYCTGDATHCHPGQKINYATHLENALSMF